MLRCILLTIDTIDPRCEHGKAKVFILLLPRQTCGTAARVKPHDGFTVATSERARF